MCYAHGVLRASILLSKIRNRVNNSPLKKIFSWETGWWRHPSLISVCTYESLSKLRCALVMFIFIILLLSPSSSLIRLVTFPSSSSLLSLSVSPPVLDFCSLSLISRTGLLYPPNTWASPPHSSAVPWCLTPLSSVSHSSPITQSDKVKYQAQGHLSTPVNSCQI